jgi:predicted ATPase
MGSLLKVRARNYLSLRDVEVELGPLNVLVGPNAGGKSNFLDVIRFLGDAAREDLRPAVERRGGYEAIRFRGAPANSGKIEIHVEAKATKHATERAPDAYTLRFWQNPLPGSPTRRILVREEELSFKRTRGQGRRIKVQGKKLTIYDEAKKPARSETPARPENLLQAESLALSTLPRLGPERGGEQVRTIADLFRTLVVFDVNVAKARKPAALHGEGLSADASNLAAFLYRLSTHPTHGDWFSAFEDDARAMIPGYERMHFRKIGGAEEAVAVEIKETGLRGRTPLSQASYGSIRALALLALLYDPSPSWLTCVEEIDHGLHPHVFDRLVELLRWASERTQFLIATHSPVLVNRLHASELIVCERDVATGATRMPAIDPGQVRAMEEKLAGKMGLGELWFTGTLGGVP